MDKTVDDALKNGTAKVQAGNPDVIRVLENVLKQAREGKVAGVAVVCAHGPEVISLASGGNFAITLSAGCVQLGDMMRSAAFAPKKSPILRAPGNMNLK